MKREDIKILQNAQLKILLQVDQICGSLGISYFLMFGSLLGTLRHQGSIPWDVDIDVALFRKDYEKLRQYCIEHNDGQYFYSDYTTSKHHYPLHAVLIDKRTHLYYTDKHTHKYSLNYDGVYIDIFPIDETSPDKALQQKQGKRIYHFWILNNLKLAVITKESTGFWKKLVKNLVSLALAPVSFRFIGKRVSAEQRRYEGYGSDCYVVPTYKNEFERIVPASTYLPARRETYEHITVPVPNKAEELLRMTYGDYMQFPPEESRWDYVENIIDRVVFEPDDQQTGR